MATSAEMSALEIVGWVALAVLFAHDVILLNPAIGIASLFGFLVGVMFDLRFSVLLVCLLLLAARRRRRDFPKEPTLQEKRELTAANGGENMTEEERRAEVCRLWKLQSSSVWQAETGPLDFYNWLTENRPELLPKVSGDPYQSLRAELSHCTDA